MGIEIGLGLMILVAAALYAAVGHGGASGYLAAMALFGLAPAEMRPTALILNVLVASIATFKYARAGCFSWPLFWPSALLAIPAAYAGGTMHLPGHYYKPLIGLILIYSAWRLLQAQRETPVEAGAIRPAPIWALLLAGAAIGFLSGLTGVGGGIFLSPLLLFAGWAGARQASGIAAPFILLNSLAGLAGLASTHPSLPSAMPLWALAALLGGYLGADYGSKRLPGSGILILLALVLLIAGVKMMLA